MEEVRQLTQEERKALKAVLRQNEERLQQARHMMELSATYTGAGDHVKALQCSNEAHTLSAAARAVDDAITDLYYNTDFMDLVLELYI